MIQRSASGRPCRPVVPRPKRARFKRIGRRAALAAVVAALLAPAAQAEPDRAALMAQHRGGTIRLLARTAAGLTQKQLAESIGAGSAWVYLLEDGQQNAQIHSLRKVAEALGVSWNSLLPDVPGVTDDQVSTVSNAMLHGTLNELVKEFADLRKSVDMLLKERASKARKQPPDRK